MNDLKGAVKVLSQAARRHFWTGPCTKELAAAKKVCRTRLQVEWSHLSCDGLIRLQYPENKVNETSQCDECTAMWQIMIIAQREVTGADVDASLKTPQFCGTDQSKRRWNKPLSLPGSQREQLRQQEA